MALRVAVVGGGFAGSVVAAALSRLGGEVRVFESAARTDVRFRGELIHPRGVRGLESLGFRGLFGRDAGVPVLGFAVTASADAAPMVLPYARGQGLGMEHTSLVLALREQVARRPGVTIETSARIDSLLKHRGRVVGVRRASGEEYYADLVVLADGRGSKLRASLGVEPEPKLLSYTIAFSADAELPFGRRGHVFLGAPGPILAYPYGEGRVRFCVDVPVDGPKGRKPIVDFLLARYAPTVPMALRAAMEASLRTHPFEGCANHSVQTRSCAASGVVLVGDSGGCSHPLTASGMTNAVNDALVLERSLRASGGEAEDDALLDYQRRRYEFVRMRELFTDNLYAVFKSADEGSAALQAGVFRYWASSASSREASMNILSGEEVRVSRFVREYTRVFGASALQVLKGLGATPERSTRQLRSLTRTTAGRVSEAFERSARQVVERYRLGLLPLT